MILSDWTLLVFGAQARLAVWLPLGAYLAWLILVWVCGIRSAGTRFWSLMALLILLPLLFVVALAATIAEPQGGDRLISVPKHMGSSWADLPFWLRVGFVWPFFVIPLGVVCSLGLGVLEYGVAAVRLWLTPKRNFSGVWVLETQGLQAFTFGLIRPRVFVSAAVWSGPHLEAVLAHEMAHVRRRDPWLFFWARAIRRSTLYLPFGGRLYRDLLLEAERVCDEAGTRAVGIKLYAAALLDFAESREHRNVAVPTTLSFAEVEVVGIAALLSAFQHLATRTSGGWIGRRVELLLKGSGRPERLGWFWFGFVVIYALILSIP